MYTPYRAFCRSTYRFLPVATPLSILFSTPFNIPFNVPFAQLLLYRHVYRFVPLFVPFATPFNIYTVIYTTRYTVIRHRYTCCIPFAMPLRTPLLIPALIPFCGYSFPIGLPLSWLGFGGRPTAEIPASSADAPWGADLDHAVLGPFFSKDGSGGYGETAFFHKVGHAVARRWWWHKPFFRATRRMHATDVLGTSC